MDAEIVVASSLHPASSAADPPRQAKCRRRLVIAIGFVVMGIVSAAAVMAPKWRTARINANESMAIAMLKNISSAQSQMQASGVMDADGDGAGEYGFFAELAGAKPVRAMPGKPDTKVEPRLLSEAFGQVVGGRARVGGYVFQMFLQDKTGRWLSEASDGGSAGVAVDAARASTHWLCYAWPLEYGSTGKRAFLIGQSGDVLTTNQQSQVYSGDLGPQPGDSGHCDIDGVRNFAANRDDVCGNTWVIV